MPRPATLRVDATTLSDLEVLAGRGGDGLLHLVDRTQTRVGRKALRRRLEAPLSRVADIRRVQDALAALAGRTEPLLFDDGALGEAEGYARSTIVLGSASRRWSRVQETWLRLRYPDIHQEMASGVAAVRSLRGRIQALAGALGPRTPAPLLKDLSHRLLDLGMRMDGALAAGGLVAVDRGLRGALRGDLLAAIELVGEIDALQAMALAGDRAGWCRPELVDGEEFLLEAEDAVHPFLPDATPNPVHLTGGEPLVFLTGPNMAGKTTYLRTVGLLVLLAQTGMRVPARRMRLSPVEAVLTSLNPVDNLRKGVSLFYAEVLRVQEAARLLAEGRPSLILFDEAFKGTNVRDALDASTEVIRGFARSRRSGSIFSSHLSELAERLGDDAPVRFRRFEGTVREGVPSFTFRLEEGVSDTRFGMLLLEQARIPELIRRIGTG